MSLVFPMTPVYSGKDIPSQVLKSLKVYHLLGDSISQKLTYFLYLYAGYMSCSGGYFVFSFK